MTPVETPVRPKIESQPSADQRLMGADSAPSDNRSLRVRHCAAPEPSYRVWRGIAENLHRAELTALEHDQHLAEWIRLTEQAEAEKNAPPVMELTRERDPEPAKRGRPRKNSGVSAQPGPKHRNKPGRPQSGVRSAARELGVTRQDAQRALKVASLTEDAKTRAEVTT